MQQAAYVVLGVAALGIIIAWLRRSAERQLAQQRLYESSLSGAPAAVGGPADGVPEGTVARWLFLAGDRRPDAEARFWTWTVIGLLCGALAAALVIYFGLIPSDDFLYWPVVIGLPLLFMFMLGALPTVRVRRARRARERQILADLYPVLELFASLAQAGLAFDAALGRVLTTLGSDRALGRELMTFQAEVLSGTERARCFRRLARRIELPQVSSFTSALIRAQEVGIGLAATMRRQAGDLRSDLRERALARAQSLPARLVFPLVICFLPGIFVMTLGPAFYGFVVGTATFGSTP
ncbi:MAG: type II secretion system F family protein [Planctomycetota bacterium]